MIASGSRFRVTSPFLALKCQSNRQIYVMLPVGATAEIVGTYDDLARPCLITMKVNGEVLFTWARDLDRCATPSALAYALG
jgi:hypothetical protein